MHRPYLSMNAFVARALARSLIGECRSIIARFVMYL